MKPTPERLQQAEAFLRECMADGRVECNSEFKCTRRWIDKVAHQKWKNMMGYKTISHIPAPHGSMPLKQAVAEIAEAVRMSPDTVYGRWKRGQLPLVVMRKLATRVDVDPKSVPAGVEAMRATIRPCYMPKEVVA